MTRPLVDRQRCGANTRHGPCKNPPCAGRRRCKFHGGAVPVGPDHPWYKHGRQSRYALPEKLRERFFGALEDPDLLVATEELALVTARINELLARIGTGDSARVWAELRAVYDDLDDPVVGARARLRMGELIKLGDKDRRLWLDLYDALIMRNKLADTEMKRRALLSQNVPVERVMAMMQAVGESITRNVKDGVPAATAIANVRRDLERMIGPSTPTPNGRQLEDGAVTVKVEASDEVRADGDEEPPP